MPDDRLIRELMESPLGDSPQRKRRGVLVGAIVVSAAVVLLAVLVWRDAPEPITTGTTPPAPGSTLAGAGTAPTDTSTTTVPAVDLFPEPSVFQEFAALGDGELLMFGGLVPVGNTATAPLEGTWVLDASTGTWSRSDPDPAPSPRFGHAMAFYPPTGRVVVFGGGATQPRNCPRTRFCTGPEDNQLWQFDPSTGTWEDMTPAVPDEDSWPAPRFGARFAYDPLSGRLILFSGVGVFGQNNTPTFYEDTWAYDPVANSWEELTREDELNPIGRTEYGMVWNEEAQRIVMFGGDSLSGTDDDSLWLFDPASAEWEEIPPADPGPRERWFHLMTSDPQSGRVVMIGGFGGQYTAITGGTIKELGPLLEVWTWSGGEGWVAQNPTAEPLIPVSGAGDPGTLGVIVYDGHDVLFYDAAVDRWEMIAARPEAEDA